MPGKGPVPLTAGILGLHLQHRQEGNYYYVNTPTLMVSWALLAGEVWKCRL